MWEFITKVFEQDFMPHGTCYGWLPEVVWLHVLSDTIIALAYGTIPITLAFFVSKRKDLAFKGMFLLFSAFILLCGATHGLSVLTVWYPTYRLTGVIKLATGLVSIGTALALIPLIPKALRLPSPKELRDANDKLQKETEERLKAEAALAEKEKEELFRAVVEAAPNGMVLLDEQHKAVLTNTACLKIFGRDREDILGKELLPYLTTETQQLFRETLTGHVQPNGTEQTRIYAQHAAGHEVPLEVGINKVRWRQESLTLVSLVDISERLEAQAAIVDVNRRFNRAVEGTSDAIWEWNIEAETVWFSPAYFEWAEHEHSDQAIPVAEFFDRIHEEDLPNVQSAVNVHFKEGVPYDQEFRFEVREGTYLWFRGRGKVIRDEAGQQSFMSGSFSNIHRRKLAEKELREKEQFLQTVFEGINHAVFVVDVNDDQSYTYSTLNRAWSEMTGIPREPFLGKSLDALSPEYIPKESIQYIQANIQACHEARKQIQIVENLPILDQQTWWITTLIPLFDSSGEVHQVLGSGTNITEIKKMEEELREREHRTRNILDGALNGIFIFCLENQQFTYLNPAFTGITGYRLADLKEIPGFTALVHPDDAERVRDHLVKVWAVREGDDLDDDLQIEYRLRHKKGRWIWCLSRDTIFKRAEDGSPFEMIGTLIDITHLKAYNERLEASNLELERFAFVASHDLREPLRKIQSFGNMLKRRFEAELPEKGQDYLGRMVNAADRMQRLIDDLLQFSRATSNHPNFSDIDLNEVVQTVLNDLSHKISHKQATVNVEPLPMVFGDQNQLYQLFMNLIANAVKYGKDDEPLIVSITCRTLESAKIQIDVQDNGIGFDEDQSKEIFQIFKRLHGRQEYEGSGIGLAICKKIVEHHSGTLTATGTRGVGATFTLTLPAMIKETQNVES